MLDAKWRKTNEGGEEEGRPLSIQCYITAVMTASANSEVTDTPTSFTFTQVFSRGFHVSSACTHTFASHGRCFLWDANDAMQGAACTLCHSSSCCFFEAWDKILTCAWPVCVATHDTVHTDRHQKTLNHQQRWTQQHQNSSQHTRACRTREVTEAMVCLPTCPPS